MAGEVCARCLWTGPATSAPGGMCPVCGSPLTDADEARTPADVDVDDSYVVELASAPDGNGGRGASAGSGGRRPISRGRWALLAVNVALLVIVVALMASTALGWRPGGAGVVNAASARPSATATTPASAIPTIGPDVLLPTPTATTTPTATPSGSGGSGGFAPTATPATPPTVAPTPTPEPTVGSGGG